MYNYIPKKLKEKENLVNLNQILLMLEVLQKEIKFR